MKRASKKKVKVVPACATSNDGLEEHLERVRPVKRQVTSAAMIGLAISIGPSSLLVTRPSDRAPAAEPVDNEPTFDIVATTTEVNLDGSINSVEPQAVKLLPVDGSSSAVVLPNPQVQPKSAAVSKPVVEHKLQKGQTLRQISQKYQVHAAGLRRVSVEIAPSNNLPKHPDFQAGKVLKNPRVNELVQKLKASKTVETRFESYGVNRSQSTPPAVISLANQQVLVDKSPRVTGEVNGALTAKQRFLINQLKQKPNHLKDRLAEWKSQESNNSFTPTKKSAEFSSIVEKTRATNPARFALPVVGVNVGQQAHSLSPESPHNDSVVLNARRMSLATPVSVVVVPNLLKSRAETTNPKSFAPLVVGATVGQQAHSLSPEVAPSNDNAVLDAQKLLQQTPDALIVVRDLSQVAVNEPTVVVPSISRDYQVKAGDTLSAIARHQGISLSELVEANKLTDPNRLQINQRLKIPALDSNAVGQTIAVIKRPTYPETTASSVAVPTLKTVSSNLSVPFVPPLSPSGNNSSVWVSTLPMTGELQANAELISSNSAATAQQKSLAVPPEPLAGSPPLGAAFSGIGGSISDEVDEISPPTVETQLAQSPAAEPEELQSQLYAQELQSDIQKLRQKYYAQQTVSPDVPVVSKTVTVVAPQRVPAPGTAVIPSTVINPRLRSNLPANQPINSQFRAAPPAETLKPAIQKQRPTQDRSPVQPRAKTRVATAPVQVDPSESLGSLRERQVSPGLPPLGTVDIYLPKPSSASFKSFIWPTRGVLTSGYGWRWGRMHKGIDLAAPIGTPIVAAAPGVVVRAGWNSGGYGNLVDIQHADGSFTRYAHNKRILVQAGQLVEQGQQISEMGSTGYSTGPHLHFEVHPGGKAAVNPIAFLPKR